MKLYRYLVIAASFALAGCKLETSTEIYVADLSTVRAGQGPIVTPMTMKFEIPNADRCAKFEKQITGALRLSFDNVQFVNCENPKRSFDHWIVYTADIPLATEFQDGSVVTIVVDVAEGTVAAVMNEGKIKEIEDKFKKENAMARLNVFRASMQIVINNDSRGDNFKFSVMKKFVNGTPYQYAEAELPSRNRAIIDLSDVDVQSLLLGYAPHGVEIFRSK